MQARPVYVAAVDLSCKMIDFIFYVLDLTPVGQNDFQFNCCLVELQCSFAFLNGVTLV